LLLVVVVTWANVVSQILFNSVTAFLQGFYPPVGTIDVAANSEPLNNGSSSTPPLNGYQYVNIEGVDTNSPDTVWLKGTDGCPAITSAAATFANSKQYKALLASTKDFYASFWPYLSSVYDYTPAKMSYANAFDIYDLISVALVHNSSFASANISADALFQLRTLSDSAEFNTNYNASQPARAIGGQTFAAAILRQLNQTIASKGDLKFSLIIGSYNVFFSFFGLTNLTSASADFYGMPNFASTMSFELFTADNQTSFPSDLSQLNVRFLFRNGSDSTATAKPFPLFGRTSPEMSWTDFQSEMKSRSILSSNEWCKACGNTDGFCLSAAAATSSSSSSAVGGKKGGLSNTVAGVIGAMVTLGVVALCGLLALLVLRRRKPASAPPMVRAMVPAKTSSSLSSGLSKDV
jgi:prostatic aicd phosphatase